MATQYAVHPRACGERAAAVDQPSLRFIPARAGNVSQMPSGHDVCRFIPARAGNVRLLA